MKQLFFIISFLATVAGYATNETLGRISGTVIDGELKEPIPYATISINDKQGNLVTGNTSAEDGTFVIDKVNAGEYTLKVQFIGYKAFTREISISTDRANVELGVISLEPDLAQLDDVNIVAERSSIEQRIDRKVINVGKDLTTLGPSASDIMGKAPNTKVFFFIIIHFHYKFQ